MDFLHFEKMSNLDLHPLSLSVSRLSPTKSTSSIDQYTHHHGKGDSAYSSFSGGSTAPEYSSSPFLAEDVHPHNLHYADLKYVRAVYGPRIIESDLKSLPQHYQSMESVTHHHQHGQNKYFHVKTSSVPAPLSPPPPPPPQPPPLPPNRLDSIVATRNFETTRMSHNTEAQQKANLKEIGSRSDLVAGHRVSYGYPRNQDLADTLLQPEYSQQDKNMRLEIKHVKSHSALDIPFSEQHHAINARHMPQHMTNGSVQHKGQFYFVTGMCESTEPQCLLDSIEPQKLAAKPRYSNAIESCLENLHLRKQNLTDCKVFQENNIASTLDVDQETSNSHVLNNFPKQEESSQNIEDMNNIQQIADMDLPRHHCPNHLIFYCSPDERFPTSAPFLNRTDTAAFMTNMDQNIYSKEDEHVNKLTRQHLASVPAEKISKESTPLLYHLTGASRVSVMNSVKSDKDLNSSSREQDQDRENQNSENEFISTSDDCVQNETLDEQKLTEFYYHCSTTDTSFKKYYKEKLKDVQSRVLRETSFKRKDLQQSWPLHIEQHSIPSGPRAHDLFPSPESLTKAHHLAFQQMDKKASRNQNDELERSPENEIFKQQNIAQPQVPRIGNRRRLTMGQKKLSRSEPEKLNQWPDGSTQMMSCSLGNEEQLLKDNSNEVGVVATRRKMFETRGRSMSASIFSRSALKQLQQKALSAYKERKTGIKVAEPQQPVPHMPTMLHNAGRRSDQTPHSGFKAKLFRPFSSGRPSSNKRTQLTTDLHSGQSSQSTSVEDLLEEQGQFNRSYSISSPVQWHLVSNSHGHRH